MSDGAGPISGNGPATGVANPARNPNLKRVIGPTALGGGTRRFAELLWLIALTDFKKTYFGTVLGYFWSLLRPLAMFAVLLFVFTQIFRIGSEVENYPMLLLFNIVVFGAFQESTIASVTSVVQQESIVRKTQFPRLVIPLAVVATAFMNLGVNLIAVLIFLLAFGIDPTWTWLLYPLVLLLLLTFSTAVAMILSSLYVRYRDVGIIWSVIVAALFYGSPVLYPLEIVPDKYRELVMANPMTPIFELGRKLVIDPGAPGPLVDGWQALIIPTAIFVGVCVLAVRVFRNEAPRIAEDL